MILDKHGIFTWGETAQESYERMIAHVTARRALAARAAATSRRAPRSRAAGAASSTPSVAPIVRGALARASGTPLDR